MDETTQPAGDGTTTPSPTPRSLKDRLRQGVLLLKPDTQILNFAQLYDAETVQLNSANAEAVVPDDVGKPQVTTGPAGEPSVNFTPYDRFGLALSGGGVRSATFNLGLLQSLGRLGILSHVDYLATVSGGGYIGAFWTAWLQRRGQRTGPARFPVGNDRRSGERAEIRHLREFSRFLLPRVGLLQTEFWGIVMTVLGGMLPSLLAALAVLATAWYVWVVGLIALTLPGWRGQCVPSISLLLYLAVSEIKWRNAGKAEHNPRETGSFVTVGLGAALLLLLWVRTGVAAPNLFAWSSFSEVTSAIAVPKALAFCTLTMLGLRLVAARLCRASDWIPLLVGVERCTMRLLGMTAGLAAVAGLWLLAGRLGEAGHALRLQLTAGGAAVSAGLFAWAKKWLTEPVTENRSGKFVDFALSWLRRATPKTLASMVWLLLFLLVGALLHRWGAESGSVLARTFWLPLVAGLAVIALTAWLFDPARVGLHEFYRSRLARCYLGAASQPTIGPEADRAARNRQIFERPGDDLTLGELRAVNRPLHLVCVAANDMSGDPLGNLYRGARSAVLSGQGITLGNETARLDHLRLSTAITASAAAFNSQMGRISMDLGPAVCFLMSALNLRLGLWVPHPSNRYRGAYALPGRFFLAELLGFSRTDGTNLHLSDGNHFENFGLYELVRRHCRYLIVSDCGADPEVAFDDLANVLRRVREDFGVEIEIDVAPLRPDAEGRVRQHAVVGTIHYNGTTGMDKGTLIYFKPALTGDEPPDVLQYRTRNQVFPHESTGDQFYNEAQWESYRRLGEHAGDSVLGFFEPPASADVNVPDRLFRDAGSRWQSAQEHSEVDSLDLGDRCAGLEHDLLTDGPARLRAEFFAEATALAALVPAPKPEPDKAAVQPAAGAKPEEELATFGYLLRVAQIMEDVWVAADTERHHANPVSEEWMNYFRRWAATPSFRRWWPIMASLYRLGLREFVEQHFAVTPVDLLSPRAGELPGPRAQLNLRPVDDADEFFRESYAARQYLQTRPRPVTSGRRLLAYDLELLGYDGALSGRKLVVGFALVREEPQSSAAPTAAWAAVWDVDEFFVPSSLHGAGFVSNLLDAVLQYYRTPGAAVPCRTFGEARVNFGPASQTANSGSLTPKPLNGNARRSRVGSIDFYKSRGFSYIKAENPRTGAITLRLVFERSLPAPTAASRTDVLAPAALTPPEDGTERTQANVAAKREYAPSTEAVPEFKGITPASPKPPAV